MIKKRDTTPKSKPGRKPGDLGDAFRGEMTNEQWEYIQAVEAFKKKHRRRFLATTDFLEVARSMGYRKVVKV